MKKFRQIISGFLLVVMLFNYATPFVNASSSPSEKIISHEEFSGKGDIETEVQLVLPINNRENMGITYTIYNAKNQSASLDLNKIKNYTDGLLDESINLGGKTYRITASKRGNKGNTLSGVDYNEKVVYFSVNVYGLEKGEYRIELKGNNFVTYKVPVTLDKYSQRISLSDDAGMFEIGDINHDGKVDEVDSNLMLEAIENNKNSYDLNLDGATDIADLNYITAIMNNKKGSAKVENTSTIIDSSNVSIGLTSETEVRGDATLSSIFDDDSNATLTLTRSDGKEVSEENPINLVLDLGGETKDNIEMSRIVVGVGDNAPKALHAKVEYADGTVKDVYPTESSIEGVLPFTDTTKEGRVVLDLGKQVAVKKVTIVITEAGNDNLADIAKVEFLNNVKVETKAPEGFGKPKNVKVDDSVSEQLTVTYQDPGNVTGYEIKITGGKMNGVIFQTTYTTFTIEDLKNYETYKIQVQAVNQEWKSGFTDEVEASPKATRTPPAPDMVKLTSIYSGLEFGWKKMDDTKTYNIYYREVGTTDYTKISDISGTSYTLKGLKAAVEYEAYVTGNNDLGEGSKSQVVKAKTLKADATIVPQFKLINTEGEDEKNAHIKDVIYSTGTMTNDNKFSIVDDNFNTYFSVNDWQINAHYSNMGAPIIVLDKSYKMNEFILTVPDSYTSSLKKGNENDLKVYYFEGDSYKEADRKVVSANLTSKKDENNRVYYVIRTTEPITATAIQFGLTAPKAPIEFNEVKIYEYDSLVDDVAKLFTDDLRVELAEGVNQAKIDELRRRADVMDNKEYNPYRDVILNDLKYAEDILNDKALNDVITLNPNISNTYNGHLGFAMTINDYQPLGVVAKPGENLTIYVGSKGNINVEVVFTQFYAEANAWQTSVRNLQKGQNIIAVPKIGSAEAERGGSVYIRYTSTPNANTPIKVRVSGGTKIPVLDTTTLTTETEKKEAIKNYINALDSHVTEIKKSYGDAFDKYTSVGASTEIATRQGLLSFSSVAVLDAINSGCNTLDEKVNRVYKSTEAFDEMIDMFYRHKGLSTDTDVATDKWPKSRINIRYMRMFDGAFMYAGGYHIGIEYGSIAGLLQASGNSENSTGYFGWGISHEVGHQINQGTLATAEVTNNVFALLAQTSNDKDKSRLEISEIYPKIYEKVTSHTIGKAQNVFVQLGMFWQLHLAYDNNKTFEDTNSIYARINKEARTFKNEQKFSKDDLLILFASKAAGKNLINFFEIWGLRASDELKAYFASDETLSKLVSEDKAIWYLNDAARRYRLSGGTGITSAKVEAKDPVVDNKNKEVTLNFKVTSESEKILGYEIIRNGEAIAFVEGDINTYIDRIGSENNRAYTYKIVAYDYLLNKTDEVTLNEVKVSYDGSIASKDTFSIESNVKAKGEVIDLEDADMDYKSLTVNNLIDGKANSSFNGVEKIKTLNATDKNVSMTTDNGNAYVIINLNDKYSISGLKYQALLTDGKLDVNTITKYNIYVSKDKVNWDLARSGSFNLTDKNNYTDTVYFMKPGTTSETQLWTYDDISYVKIESNGNKNGLSGVEIDIIAPPGDNIDISVTEDGIPTLGKLDKDYVYDAEKGEDGIIKAGSVIIKGEYRGNPSFNVVMIKDAYNEDIIYSGEQLLFAELNDDMSVYDVASGTWMYILTKEQYEDLLAKSKAIRAILYRVNDAIENSGQRITSTSTAVTNLQPYSELPAMSITDSKGNN